MKALIPVGVTNWFNQLGLSFADDSAEKPITVFVIFN